ncbi:hypothetical protein [Paenibacillus bovis]|uniref:Lipoprotein n=1 Tax=Paenibacillus bovis TaxID=1616788 RepID=A0A172ZGR3_9BACL|nr:hypothetical protein [Paenibacillus bovis]ANF96841.1 hypothetical protein AR543_13025 [Paenibacillus bovis]
MQLNKQSLFKRIPFAFILLAGVLLLAACGNKAEQQPAAAPAPNSSTETEVTEQTPSTPATTPEDNTEATNGNGAEASSPKTDDGTKSEGTTKGTTDTAAADDTTANAETQVAKGTFSGLADEHSAEIMVDGSPVVYQLNDSVQNAMSKLKEGSEITFKYTEKPIPGDASTKLKTIVEVEQSK